MQTVEFVVPGLAGSGQADDLGNTLTALNGVAHVDMDLAARTVSVSYDPDFSNPSIIEGNITGAGYQVGGEKAGT